MRVLFLGLVILLAAVAHAESIQPRAGDPSVDGKAYLLSDSEFRAAVAAVRAFTMGTSPRRVTVVSRTQVRAWLEDGDSVSCLILEHSGNGWRVAQVEWSPSHKRPNHSMKPTAHFARVQILS